MNTLQLETNVPSQLLLADVSHDLPRELGEGLVLRFATAADAEALAQFNGRIHGVERPDKFDPMVAAWTRDYCSERHPACGPSNVTLVEDTRTGTPRVVSTMCLISQTWMYAGTPFEVGRPEAVGPIPTTGDEDWCARSSTCCTPKVRRWATWSRASRASRGIIASSGTSTRSTWRRPQHVLGQHPRAQGRPD